MIAYHINHNHIIIKVADAPPAPKILCEDCDGHGLNSAETFNIGIFVFSDGSANIACRGCAWINHGVLIAPATDADHEV